MCPLYYLTASGYESYDQAHQLNRRQTRPFVALTSASNVRHQSISIMPCKDLRLRPNVLKPIKLTSRDNCSKQEEARTRLLFANK